MGDVLAHRRPLGRHHALPACHGFEEGHPDPLMQPRRDIDAEAREHRVQRAPILEPARQRDAITRNLCPIRHPRRHRAGVGVVMQMHPPPIPHRQQPLEHRPAELLPPRPAEHAILRHHRRHTRGVREILEPRAVQPAPHRPLMHGAAKGDDPCPRRHPRPELRPQMPCAVLHRVPVDRHPRPRGDQRLQRLLHLPHMDGVESAGQ